MSIFQCFYLRHELPDLLTTKRVEPEVVNDVVSTDLMRLMLSLSNYEIESHIPKRHGCFSRPYTFEKEDISAKDFVETFNNKVISAPSMPLSCGPIWMLKKAMWTKVYKEKKCCASDSCSVCCESLISCAEACFTCASCLSTCLRMLNPDFWFRCECCCLFCKVCEIPCTGCCTDRTIVDVSKIEKAKTLMSQLHAISYHIQSLKVKSGCCCFEQDLPSDKGFVKKAMFYEILGQVEELLHDSLGSIEYTANPNSDYITYNNDRFLEANKKDHSERDYISKELVKYMEKSCGINEVQGHNQNAVTNACTFYDKEGDYDEIIFSNYKHLIAGSTNYIPENLHGIMNILIDKLNVVDYTNHIKSGKDVVKPADSNEHLVVYDMFTVRLYIHNKTMFNLFADAAKCVQKISEMDNVEGIRAYHHVDTDTAHSSYNFVVKLKHDRGVAQFEVLPVSNFITTSTIEDFEKTKEKLRLEKARAESSK